MAELKLIYNRIIPSLAIDDQVTVMIKGVSKQFKISQIRTTSTITAVGTNGYSEVELTQI